MRKEQQKWAYFDFDDTISQGDSILWWNQYLFKRHFFLRFYGLLIWLSLPLVALKLINKMTFKRILLAPSGFLSSTEQQEYSVDFIKNHLSKKFYPEILSEISRLKKEGYKIAVLSASADFYLQPLLKLLDVDHFKATSMSFPNSQGSLLNLPIFNEANFKGNKKVEYILDNPLFPNTGEQAWAFSDHHSDSFLLDFAEKGISVNPNKKLRTLSIEKKWDIVIPSRAKSRWKLQLVKLRLFLFGWI